MKIINLLTGAAMVVAVSACDSDMPQFNDTLPEKIELNTAEQTAVDAQTDFAFRLYAAQAESEKEEKNVIVSPMSVTLSLSMFANGTEGDFLNRVLEEFGVTDLKALNALNNKMARSLRGVNPSKVTLEFANGLWENSRYGVSGDYKGLLSEEYGADIATLDFGTGDVKTAVNRWVSNRTKGLIEEILKEKVSETALMVLANTVYFKAEWSNKFTVTGTEPFYDSDNREKGQAEMMNVENIFRYKEKAGEYQAVNISYGNGGFEMIVVLPAEGKTPEKILSEMKSQDLKELCEEGVLRKVNLRMPKFDTDYDCEIQESLKAMGLDMGKANTSGINADAIDTIWKIFHGTRLIVNEDRTEAAGTTVTGGLTSCAPEKVKMTVNRPFGCIIRETSTGAILFMGHVTMP